ncbi:MAG: outer membrane protein assembly factor BamB, partial [Mariniblastus sp.]
MRRNGKTNFSTDRDINGVNRFRDCQIKFQNPTPEDLKTLLEIHPEPKSRPTIIHQHSKYKRKHLMKPNLLTLLLVTLVTTSVSSADDWWQFRGKGGASSTAAKVPTTFDDQTNIAWKIEMPGKGASSPIVVGDQVVVTCSGGDNQDELYAVSIDAKTGKRNWTQKFWATGRCFVHPLSANAAPTPASDGKHIYVFYSSNDLACLDLKGNLVWFRGLAVDHPKSGNDVGMASSPVVKDGVVVVQVENQGDSFAMGLDAETGTTIWTQTRAQEGVWTSPIIIEAANTAPMVLLQSKADFDVLDLKTGQQKFKAEGAVSTISSPAAVNGKVYVPINGTTAYSVSSDGQLQQEWNSGKLRPASMSSIVHGDNIFTLNRAGALMTYSAADGTEKNKVRVISGSGNWATPVVAGNHMYVFAQNGQAYVVDLADGEP